MTMPLFRSYILSRYERMRGDADIPLLGLEEMKHNLESQQLDRGHQA